MVLAFIVELFTCVFMTGVIWIIQQVHYPLFYKVGKEGYAAYQGEHMRRITWVVLPVMVVEFAAATYLVYSHFQGDDAGLGTYQTGLVWGNFIGLLLIWSSTALLQVPSHQRLTVGFNEVEHKYLVRSNWLRTIIWTLRSLAIAYCALVLLEVQ